MFNRRGPERAFLRGLELEQHQNDLHKFLRGRVDSQSVLDVAQDTWVKVLAAIKRGERIENLGAFMTHVARNVAIDHLRRKRTRSVVISSEDAEIDKFSERHCMDMPHESVSLLEEFERAVEKLDDRDQAIIRMAALTTMSRQEMAEQLGLTEGTLRKYTDRALAKIQAAEKEE